MKIALLAITTEWGGTEGHAVELSRKLGERGHAAIIVCLTECTYQLYRDRSRHQIQLASLFLPKEWWRMGFGDWLRLFAGQFWDAVVLIKGHFPAGGSTIDLAVRCCFGNYMTLEHLQADPIPAKTRRVHLGFIPGLGLWWYRDRFRGFLRSIGPRKVVCVSDAVRKQLTEGHRFPARKLITVRNGVDIQRFQRDPAAAETWRRRWGISRGGLVFGAVGRFHRMKGYDTLLSCFRKLLTGVPERDLWLVLVGEGPQKEALKTLAEELVPGGRAIFSPFCDRPWEPLSALDVFVMPSLNEGLPLTLLEAMACGCCPVATAVGGIPEVVSSSELGWLVPAGNVDAFAAAMIDAASRTSEQREAMGERAREHVLANFNASVQFNILADIIESLALTPRGLRAGSPILPSHPN
jgi:glycosyltransferase involved in cell wall biosynthesis